MHYIVIGATVVCLGASQAAAELAVMFVSRPQQVIRLTDRNGDGDFLDYAESEVYADGLAVSLGALAVDGEKLLVVDITGARLLSLRDLNGDGDVLDYAEVAVYGELPQAGLSPIAAGCAVQGGLCYVADSANGLLYRFRDFNQDGDALDNNECTLVAVGLVVPSVLTIRPDGKLLVAQGSTEAPVRILFDRNDDGDFLDFAENISYAEGIAVGSDLVATANDSAYLARPDQGEVILLFDRTGDGDVLDYGEIVPHAEGLDQPSALAVDVGSGLFVAARDAAGSIYRLVDRNGDGDALDYAEVITVALGVQQPGGIALVHAEAGCRPGDIDGSGSADLNDVPLFVNALLGLTVLSDPCPADRNDDGRIDGADISPFIEAVL